MAEVCLFCDIIFAYSCIDVRVLRHRGETNHNNNLFETVHYEIYKRGTHGLENIVRSARYESQI